ncbi:MAG TPA: MATE family efflux transporter [Tepidisphaeraceae bacterium]|jgi:MATE family multidrug resistance protein|nr:MATE family efflux transporter [Tepidisphaeraceae bacterium]
MSEALNHQSNLPLEGKPQRPIVELLALALPTIAQMASYTAMQFADTLQLAVGAGDVAATAAGLAGFMVFCVQGWCFGALMCVNTLVSQSVGAGKNADCGRYLWQGIWFGIIGGLVLVPTMIFVRPILEYMGHGPQLIADANTYYSIEVLALPVRLAGLALGQFMLGIGRPRITLFAAVIAVAVDVGLNFIFITGRYGFPAYGVAGAAWATNAAVCVEAGIIAGFAFGPKLRGVYQTMRAKLHGPSIKQLIRIGFPSGIQVVSEIAAWFVFMMWIMAMYGQATMAANNYMMQYMKVSFMPAFGLSGAVTALVGRYVGMGRLDLARRRAHLGFAVATTYMISCGLVFWFGRHHLIQLFSDDPEVVRIGAILLALAAVYQLVDALYIIYIGALRGVGDTAVPAWITAILCWSIVVGGGALVANRWPSFGPLGPWLMAVTYGVILGGILLIRFSRGNWKAIVTKDAPVQDPASPPADVELVAAQTT